MMTVKGPVYILLESGVTVALSTNTSPQIIASPSEGVSVQDGPFALQDSAIVRDLLGIAANPSQARVENQNYPIGHGYTPQVTYKGTNIPGSPITHFSLTQDLTIPPTTELSATTTARIDKTTSVDISYSVKATFIPLQQPPPGIPVISKPATTWEQLLVVAALAMLRVAGYGRAGTPIRG
jgi:hypothetical protein